MSPTEPSTRPGVPGPVHRQTHHAPRRRLALAMTAGAATLLMAACGGSAIDGEPASESTTVTSTTTSSPETEPPIQTEPPSKTTGQPAPAPETRPAVPEMPEQSGPQIGDQCAGADIGRKNVDANGTAIVCDNYQWAADVGQVPRHPWADSQREWSECLEEHTTEECREMLN